MRGALDYALDKGCLAHQHGARLARLLIVPGTVLRREPPATREGTHVRVCAMSHLRVSPEGVVTVSTDENFGGDSGSGGRLVATESRESCGGKAGSKAGSKE